jgi:plastocyanin
VLRRFRHLLVVLVAAAVLAGCGADASEQGSAGTADPVGGDLAVDRALDRRGAADVTVEVADNVFEPRAVRIDPGSTVTWTNTGQNTHNVMPAEEGRFEPVPTGSLDPKASASRTFSVPGVYRYYCSIHGTATRGQRGVIVVGDEGL